MNIGTTAIVAAASVFAWSAPQVALPPGVLVAGSGVPLEQAATGSGAVVNEGAVVVNEFAPGAYVELRNNSLSTVDIGGFNLWLCGPDGVTAEVRVSLGRTLAPGDFYVIASSGFTGAPADQTHWDVLPGGGAVLLDPDYIWADGTAVVADSPCGEGVPAPTCPQASTARNAVSNDTGSNIADFACRIRSPGEPNPAG